MRLNKATSHAIRILIDCAKSGDQLVKVAEIAERLGITQQNSFKIVHLLSRAGFLKAMRGRYGGVRLSRPASEIRIGDVVRLIETTHVEVEEDKPTSRRGKAGAGAGINKILDEALDAFISVLDQHTLADLAKSASSGGTEQPRREPRKLAVKAAVSGAFRSRRSGLPSSAG